MERYMFSNLDLDNFGNLGRIAGIALFAVAFVLPGVHGGQTSYSGFECAWITLVATPSWFASLRDRSNGDLSFLLMVSGWIAPLVLLGAVIKSEKVKRGVAKILPVLLLAPWVVFAWPQSGWGAVPIHPGIGHYVWTAGCLLIFTPEYVAMLSPTKKDKNEDTASN